MNGARTNARRRSRASAPLATSGKNKDSNDSVYHDGSNGEDKIRGRRRKSNEKAQVQLRRYVRRKGKNISRIKQMCSKIGKLRVLDVMVFIGLAFKLASIIYSRRVPSSTSTSPIHRDPSILSEPEPTAGGVELVGETLNDNKLLSPPKEWLKRWAEHRMPFHSPLLYRREDDDYSFGYDSYPEDDDRDDDRSKQRNNLRQQKQKVGLKGMLLRGYPVDHYVEQLNGNGYAVVDDVLYNVDEYREYTVWALDESELQLNDPVSYDTADFMLPAFGISNPTDEDEDEPRGHIDDDGNFDRYYSFDDDLVRGTLGMGLSDSDSTTDFDNVCTAPSFYRTYQPNCNELHASLSGYQWLFGEELFSRRWKKRKHLAAEKSHLAKYLSSGYYRDAFMFQSSFVSYDGNDKPSTQWDEVVFKTMRHMEKSSTAESNDDAMESLGFGFDPEDKYSFLQYQEDMRKDAMLMELLSSSPRTTDIYAHCSMSSVIELVPVDLEEYILPTLGYSPKKIIRGGSETEREEPLNDHITPEEKLEIALEMAKCLAAMHGYEDGVIAHVDLQLGQFRRGRDGLIKIIDFNRAEPLLYDMNKEKYCKWCNGEPPDGTFRAPEEHVDGPLDENIDVYSLGNIFYSILTGKLVWVDFDHEERNERIVEGYPLEIPDFYEENEASKKLVITIKACWNYEVDDRPSIFKVVEFLEDAVASSRK